MRLRCTLARGVLGIAVLAGTVTPVRAQRIALEKRVFNEEVLRPHGQPVIPLFEGWYANQDGTHDICFGYFNLNTEEPVDIPLGEGNVLRPSEYDGKQPTHFAPVPGMTPVSQFTSRFRRIWCAFTVTVPADFGPDDRVTWTLERPGGEPVSVPGGLQPPYVLDEPVSDGRGQVAPMLRLAEGGTSFQGRHGFTAPATKTVGVGRPLGLRVWIEHPAEDQVWVGWLQYSGPGTVTFAPAEQRVALTHHEGVASGSATFDQPGDYELLVQSISTTASFEYHCCWTNGRVRVHVTK